MRALSVLLLLVLLPLSAVAKPLVVASIEPLHLFAQEYFGDKVEVKTLLRPSQDPHHASFSPQQLLLVNQADLVLWLGKMAEPYFTPYLPKTSAISVALLAQPGVNPLHRDSARLDPHLWLDPVLLEKMLPALKQAGIKMGLPASYLSARGKQITQKYAAMIAKAKQEVAPVASTPWLSYHNPWHYLQTRIGLTPPLTVEHEFGAKPGSRHFVLLAQQVKAEKVACGLLEPEANRAMMERLCEVGSCTLEPLDPMGRGTELAQYSTWWQWLVTKVDACLSQPR